MAAAEVAGVVPVPNWNSLAATNNAVANPLVDDAGAATGANITWSTSNNYSVNIGNAPGNQKMLNGYIDTDNVTTNTFTVASLPASFGNVFSVYVYTDGDGTDNRFGTYSINGSPGILVRDTTNGTSAGATFDNATSDQIGNYILFQNVIRNGAGGFILSATPTIGVGSTPRAPVNGLQIVPEPSRLLLGLMSSLGLLLVRRRRSA